MSIEHARHGLPSDLPPALAREVRALAQRDAKGQRTPTLIGGYRGRDGRWKRLVWLPAGDYAALARRRAPGGTGGDAA